MVAGDGVDIQAGVKSTVVTGEDPYVTDAGTFNVAVGNVTANNGTLLITGRDGITAGAVTQSRTTSTVPSVPAELDLQTKTGSIKATGVNAKGFIASVSDAGTGGRLRVVAPQGIELLSARGSDVELTAQAGEVRVGTQSIQFNAGPVTATSGDATVSGRAVTVGNVTAGRDISLTSTASTGALSFGDLTATRNLTLSSASNLTLDPDRVKGTPTAISASSTGGKLCVGETSGQGNNCNGEKLEETTATLALSAQGDIESGEIVARSLTANSSAGAINAGRVTASVGAVTLTAPQGIKTGGVSTSAGNIVLTATGGAIVATDDITANGSTSFVEARGQSVSVGRVTAGGAITVASSGTADNAKNTSTGNLSSSLFVEASSANGDVTTGTITAGTAKTLANDPCNGLAVCVRAGAGATTGTQVATVGQVSSSGSVSVQGRTGVKTTSTVTASAGSVTLNSQAGNVDAGAGKITAGTSTGDYDVTVTGQSVTVAAIEARDDITLSATGTAGTLVTAALQWGDALQLSAASTLNLAVSQWVSSAPSAVSLTSTAGGVCLGTVSGSTCTPGAF
ncbi:MAG: hypothetical protein EB027_06225, partial [Actinobacteria bacterium]|nr:hypothetical protein [Actinomycetota bacterium]